MDSEVSGVAGSRKVIRSFLTTSLTREPLKPTRETPTITVKRENHLWVGQREGVGLSCVGRDRTDIAKDGGGGTGR